MLHDLIVTKKPSNQAKNRPLYDYISIIENLIIIYRLYKKLAEGKKIVHRTNVQNDGGRTEFKTDSTAQLRVFQ